MRQSPAETLPCCQSSAYIFREAKNEDAGNIVDCYESVFGAHGVKAPGHEPYPAPDVFSEEGVKLIVKDPLRQFMVIEIDGEIAAGMIISHNSRFHREFGCVAVSKRYQGRGISTLMLKECKKLEQQQSLSVNVTEIVTHSMLSQSAHKNAGYGQVTGFGFCQYPNVFFLHHPESCLWITSFEGAVIETLRQSRPSWRLQHSLDPARGAELEGTELTLLNKLKAPRSIFVPPSYLQIVSKIASQFDDTFTYRIFADAESHTQHSHWNSRFASDDCGDNPYAYLNLPARQIDREELLTHMGKLANQKKRYIQARVPTINGSAIKNIDLLRAHGFVFLGWVPLHRCTQQKEPDFDDVLIMQWIRPDVVAANALPGETNAVVKLHGYPLNLTGDLISTIRKDLNSAGRRNWSD